MGSLMKKQAERFLREKKRHRRWLAMFLCLALVVTSGTFAALRMNGHAMDHGGKILNCRLRVHAHSDECFDGEGKMICGQADYAVHTHDARCHNDEGELVCQLPEREAHVHDSACYAEEKVLTCKEEETAGHQHSPECYIEEPGELVCSLPEHEHSELCYDELGNLVCGQEAHYHDNSCYAVNEVLICGQEEGQGGHAHTDACYETQKKLTCKELELHTHDREKCYDANGNLICGKLELQEHEHGEGCFEDEEIPGMDIENEEFLADGEPDKNAPEESASDNAKDPSEEQASENSVSGDSVSQDAVSENSVSENGVSENSVSENSVSDNSVSENSVSENSVSGNGVSENSVSENKIITLETKVDGTTITLSGPQESFDPEKEYEIEAKAIKENSKEGKQIKKAIDKAMEKEEGEAEKYRAFDIKLMSDGEEVQPKGAVSVNFVSKDIKKSVADENTEVSVFHVDDKAKKAEDMEAETTEEGTVTMETTHFSIYVIVDKGGWGGEIEVELQHWGKKISTVSTNDLDSNVKDITDPYMLELNMNSDEKGKRYGLHTKDEIYNTVTKSIRSKNYTGELYKADKIKLENELKNYPIEDLSKIFREMGVGAKQQKYNLTEIWISQKPEATKDEDGKDKEKWEEGSYVKYNVKTVSGNTTVSTNEAGEKVETVSRNLVAVDENGDETDPRYITLSQNSVIRFLYEESTGKPYEQTVDFYDYDLTVNNNKTKSSKHSASEQGVNSIGNFTGTGKKMGVGQDSSGNTSPWSIWGSEPAWLNYAKNVMPGFGLLNGGNYYNDYRDLKNQAGLTDIMFRTTLTSEQLSTEANARANGGHKLALPVKGLVKDTLVNNELVFADGINQPGFFSAGTGKTKLDGYTLEFSKKGDTYTLSKVRKNGTPTLENLEDIGKGKGKTVHAGHNDSNLYSNNFFPLDGETCVKDDKGICTTHKGGDLHLAKSDDDEHHNWHFGMRYTFKFTVGDYTGPMNYYFRGDDDFWLFVDGQKAVDLGGIHSSVGEAINLRQWMSQKGLLEETDLDREHRVDVFYMERGGYGSCCYMQFTLPNCIPADDVVVDEHVNVEARKVWKDENDKDLEEHPASVSINLVRRDTSTGIETREEPVTLSANSADGPWYHKWENLPAKNINNPSVRYEYYIEEANVPDNYEADIESGEPKITETKNEKGEVIHKLTSYSYTVKNTRRPPKKTKVTVKKVWEENGVSTNGIRPQEIQVRLRADGDIVQGRQYQVSLNNANGWTYTWENLPKEKWTGKEYKEIVYKVEEINVPKGYIVTYGTPEVVSANGMNTENSTSVTITNTLDPKWQIIKRNANKRDKFLSGAEFELKANNAVSYNGLSGSNGVIKWYLPGQMPKYTETADDSETVEDEGEADTATNDEGGEDTPEENSGETVENGPEVDGANDAGEPDGDEVLNDGAGTPEDDSYRTVGDMPEDIAAENPGSGNSEAKEAKIRPGTYILKETKAPAGFALSEETWTITISDKGVFQSIAKNNKDGKPIDSPMTPECTTPDGIVMATFYFDNEMFYELPETGGIGTYWYTISGMLLMMGASLILYKNRRRQAVRR